MVVRGVCAFSLCLASASLVSFAGESGASPLTPAERPAEANIQQLLQAVLQLQGQLCSNQLAIEQDEKEAKEAVARNAQALSNELQNLETSFAAQQGAFSARSARELEVMQSSNRIMLVVGGTFAALALVAMLITAYFQWRMSKIWAGISGLLPAARGLGYGTPAAALGTGEPPQVAPGQIEDSNLRLLGAVEQLKKRIQVLEHGSKPTLTLHAPDIPSGDKRGSPVASRSGPASGAAEESAADADARIASLLRQSLLKGQDLAGARAGKPAWGEANLGALAGAVVAAIGGLFAVGIAPAIAGHNLALLFATPRLGLLCWLVSGPVGWLIGGQIGPRLGDKFDNERAGILGGALGGLIPVTLIALWAWYMIMPH